MMNFKRLCRFFITREEVESKAFEIIKRYTKEEVTPSSKFMDLKLNQYDYAEILVMLEYSLDANMNPEDLFNFESVDTMVDHFHTFINTPQPPPKEEVSDSD